MDPPPTSRNDITQVYQELPTVYDMLSFYVPVTEPACRRTVKIADTFYEVWSPNCDKVDFYPGAPLTNVLSSWHSPPYRYIDGRLGPRDWSLHPQHFNPDAPWLGFCQSPPTAERHLDTWRSTNPELVPLRAVWQPSKNGHLDPEYLSLMRSRVDELWQKLRRYKCPYDEDDMISRALQYAPVYPSPEDFEYFVAKPYSDFQDMVDRFTAIQRGMREIEAWLTMMHYGKFRRPSPKFSIPMAKSDRIGVWLNGASGLDACWLLRIGVIPLYIIHTYQEDVDFPVSNISIRDRRQTNYDVNLVSRTRAERLNSRPWNSYLVAPSQTDHNETSIVVRDEFQQVAQFDRDELSIARSASWSFRVAQRENKLPVDDFFQKLSMDVACTGDDSRIAGTSQGDPTSSLP